MTLREFADPLMLAGKPCSDAHVLCVRSGPKKQEGGVQLIPLSRANNVSIMLTQFSNFRRGPQDIRRAVINGELGPERLSLLLQVCASDHLQQAQAVGLLFAECLLTPMHCRRRSRRRTTSRRHASSIVGG